MDGKWQYRISSVTGVVLISSISVLVTNSHAAQQFLISMPLVGRLPVEPPNATEGLLELALTVLVVTVACVPLYKPRPRQILDTILTVQRRTIVALFMLATIGYFDYTYRLPRITLVAITPILLTTLPLWFVQIRSQPSEEPSNVVIVGDDADEIEQLVTDSSLDFLGYLCPPGALITDTSAARQPLADGGAVSEGVERLGGLSRLDDILIAYDVDTVVLAFERADRGEFFGTLDTCHELGVSVKVNGRRSDAVLTSSEAADSLVDVEVEPWDGQDYLLKRVFDFLFSAVGLIVAAPLIGVIALSIWLDDGRPILYQQERTAVFGETFRIHKFRTMVPKEESAEPVDDKENERITGVGHILRQTHLDEVPQLWSILVGDMSVVGPRAVWTKEENVLESEVESWRQRWFVKPGLTGLAQINNVSSTDPAEKLRYDLQYVRQQSIWLDIKIVLRQLWSVVIDFTKLVT